MKKNRQELIKTDFDLSPTLIKQGMNSSEQEVNDGLLLQIDTFHHRALLLISLQELSTAMDQKLFEFQEVTKEKQMLERELREIMDELDKLHGKEGKVEKMLKQLEEEYNSQTEELVLLQAKLQGFVIKQ